MRRRSSISRPLLSVSSTPPAQGAGRGGGRAGAVGGRAGGRAGGRREQSSAAPAPGAQQRARRTVGDVGLPAHHHLAARVVARQRPHRPLHLERVGAGVQASGQRRPGAKRLAHLLRRRAAAAARGAAGGGSIGRAWHTHGGATERRQAEPARPRSKPRSRSRSSMPAPAPHARARARARAAAPAPAGPARSPRRGAPPPAARLARRTAA